MKAENPKHQQCQLEGWGAIQHLFKTISEQENFQNELGKFIEKAFDDAFYKGYNVGHNDAQSHPLALTIATHIHNDRQDYILNLKVDI